MERLLTVDELAERLQTCRRTIYTYVKLGKLRRWRESDIRAWVEKLEREAKR